MSVTQNINKLPPEILNEVFKNLASEYTGTWSYKIKANAVYSSNIETCSRVCKLWRLVIKKDIECNNLIKVNDYMLPELAEDISRFGHTVRSIRLIIDREYESCTILAQWKKILKACTKLVSLDFAIPYNDNVKYLTTLQDCDIKLKNIQSIYVTRIDDHPLLSTLDIYLEVQIPYCATITSLYIYYPLELPVIKKYNRFIPFISKFPRLTNLAIRFSFGTDNEDLDIKRVLQAAPHLQKLHLYGVSMITDNFQIDEFENIRLTHLKIDVETMKLTSLNNIMSSLLNRVNHLYLCIYYLITDDLSEKESNKLLNDFQTILLDINEVYVQIVNIKKTIKLSDSVTDSILFESNVNKVEEEKDCDEYRLDSWRENYFSLEDYDNDYLAQVYGPYG